MRFPTALAILGFAILAAGPAAANLNTCLTGCAIPFAPLASADWSYPTDGRLYRWDLIVRSADPNAEAWLDPPNLVDSVFFKENPDGSRSPVIDPATVLALAPPGQPVYPTPQPFPLVPSPIPYLWDEHIAPLDTSIYLQTVPNWDQCSNPAYTDFICSATYILGNNGQPLHYFSPLNLPGTMFWKITAIPEPGTWALSIVGLGLVGAALRRRRPMVLRTQPIRIKREAR